MQLNVKRQSQHTNYLDLEIKNLTPGKLFALRQMFERMEPTGSLQHEIRSFMIANLSKRIQELQS
jgi:hypothetical protein